MEAELIKIVSNEDGAKVFVGEKLLMNIDRGDEGLMVLTEFLEKVEIPFEWEDCCG